MDLSRQRRRRIDSALPFEGTADEILTKIVLDGHVPLRVYLDRPVYNSLHRTARRAPD